MTLIIRVHLRFVFLFRLIYCRCDIEGSRAPDPCSNGLSLSSVEYSLDPTLGTVTLLPMRKLLAALLLFCVGILIPASASPVRICFLEIKLKLTQADSKCCSDCKQGTEQPDPCCHDLKELPDSGVPQLPVELPPVVITDLPADLPAALVITRICTENFTVSTPIRGPTSPSSYRAVLGIWRL